MFFLEHDDLYHGMSYGVFPFFFHAFLFCFHCCLICVGFVLVIASVSVAPPSLLPAFVSLLARLNF